MLQTKHNQQAAKEHFNSQIFMRDVDAIRSKAFAEIDQGRRGELGQYPTPSKIAMLMASMFDSIDGKTVHLLDPGAGVGSLTAAYVMHICAGRNQMQKLCVSAFEIDNSLIKGLAQTFAKCGRVCNESGIEFDGRLIAGDFISEAITLLGSSTRNIFPAYDCAILNPPYKKMGANSEHRLMLRKVGIKTSNLYTAFLALVIKLLKPSGEMAAIVPRSFCNGPYFKAFRELLLSEMSLRRIHVFESRSSVFSDEDVLQENIIIHAIKSPNKSATIQISVSHDSADKQQIRNVPYQDVVKSDDPNQFIHIIANDAGSVVSSLMLGLKNKLADIGLIVSTGRVVDFRSREWIKATPEVGTVPLIYPTHFSKGWVSWPRLGHKKPNAFIENSQSEKWLVPSAIYVLTKRFSAKEEKRRVVAAIFDPKMVSCKKVAIENHVNYFHASGHGLTINLALGLAGFLNSAVVDTYFRQFNGHTQVNATDLKNLHYPSRLQLEELGKTFKGELPSQQDLDKIIEDGLLKWQST